MPTRPSVTGLNASLVRLIVLWICSAIWVLRAVVAQLLYRAGTRVLRPRCNNAPMDYTTVAKRAEHVEVIRASRFIGLAAPIEDVQEAEALIGEARTLHPDANHHCWAWRFGPDMRFSDDGEPGGTAGRPM